MTLSSGQSGDQTNFEELKRMVLGTLEKKGVLGELRATIRSHVCEAVDRDDYEQEKTKAASLISGGEVLAELVAEFLEFYDLHNALKIFSPEISLPSMRRTRNELASLYGLQSIDSKQSILHHLVPQVIEPKMQSTPRQTQSPAGTPVRTPHLTHVLKESIKQEDQRKGVLDLSALIADPPSRSPGRQDPLYLSPRSREHVSKEAQQESKLFEYSPHSLDEDSIEADMARLRQINEEILQAARGDNIRTVIRLDDASTLAPVDSNDIHLETLEEESELAHTTTHIHEHSEQDALDAYRDDFEPDVQISESFDFKPRVLSDDAVIFESREFLADLGGESADSETIERYDHYEEIEQSDSN